MMSRRTIVLVVAGLLSLLLLSCRADPADKDKGGNVLLHRISEIQPATGINTHEGEEKWSVLQPIWSDFSLLPPGRLIDQSLSEGQTTPYYPRIKKMANGQYLLLYMGGQYGSRCYASISADLQLWSAPQTLLEPKNVTVSGASDWERYSGPDAVVLPDGDVLAVFSYRANDHYSQSLGCGLVTMRSRDNGRTWSTPRYIYDGATWEPYLLALPDGRVQCYFTDPIPASRNSGTSVMTSFDGGHTWSGKIRCSRLYKYNYDGPNTAYTGQKIFTDQMPSFRVLNDGKTIVGFLEARLETPASNSGTSYYKMSLVYNDGLDWIDLGENGEGPERRQSLVVGGAGGYVSTFPSGEVALSCNINKQFSLKLGDHTATAFGSWESGWFKPFSYEGVWGSTEAEDGNKLIVAVNSSKNGLQLGRRWLNQTLFARSLAVSMDGKGEVWPLEQALYVSTKGGAEVMVRAARDEKNLYLIADQYDLANLRILVSDTTPATAARIEVSAAGDVTATGANSTVKTSAAKTSGGLRGRVTEVSIPLSALGAATGDAVRIYISLSGSSGESALTNAVMSSPSTWQRIKLL